MLEGLDLRVSLLFCPRSKAVFIISSCPELESLFHSHYLSIVFLCALASGKYGYAELISSSQHISVHIAASLSGKYMTWQGDAHIMRWENTA
jgi:hypothetical protein